MIETYLSFISTGTATLHYSQASAVKFDRSGKDKARQHEAAVPFASTCDHPPLILQPATQLISVYAARFRVRPADVRG
jgi:hypothetical protein